MPARLANGNTAPSSHSRDGVKENELARDHHAPRRPLSQAGGADDNPRRTDRGRARGRHPRHGGRDRFGINTRKRLFNCRGCGARGDVITLVMIAKDASFAGAVTELANETMAPDARPAAAAPGSAKSDSGYERPTRKQPVFGISASRLPARSPNAACVGRAPTAARYRRRSAVRYVRISCPASRPSNGANEKKDRQ